MKLSLLFLAVGATAFGQSDVTTFRADTVNGGFSQSSSSSSTDHTQSQIATSLNWNNVPLETHQERVLRQDASGSVVETIFKRTDPTGTSSSTERIVTETTNLPNGGAKVQSTTYQFDINGNDQVTQRSTTDTSVSGDTSTSNTVVERMTLNGTFQPVQKSESVTQGNDKKSTTTETIYRGSPDAGFQEAARTVTLQSKSGGHTSTDTSEYYPGAETGSLQLQERRVSNTTKAADGTESTIVDVYGPSADGHAQAAGQPPQLKQEQIITRAKAADGSTVETFAVREPNVTQANALGEARVISKTVCTGKCDAKAEPSPGTPLPGSTAETGAQSKP